LEEPERLDAIVREKKCKKRFLREKLGSDIITAYDEQKRLLVVCGVDAQKVCQIELIIVLGADVHH
jgi:hypothetical protein